MPRGPDKAARRSGATCAICGLVAGNSRGLPVHRYRLQRSGYREGKGTTLSLGTLGLCDDDINRYAQPVRDYSDRNTVVKHRHRRLTDLAYEYHVHADFLPGHDHPALDHEGAAEPMQPDDHADDPTAAWTAEEQVAMQTGDPLVEKD